MERWVAARKQGLVRSCCNSTYCSTSLMYLKISAAQKAACAIKYALHASGPCNAICWASEPSRLSPAMAQKVSGYTLGWSLG